MTPSMNELMGMSDAQINALMNQGALSPETGYQIKKARQGIPRGPPFLDPREGAAYSVQQIKNDLGMPTGPDRPLSPDAPFSGGQTGLSQDPSQAWKPPPTPEPSGYALDVKRGAPPAPSSSPVPSPADDGASTPASAAPSPGGESPLDAAMRIQGKLEGAAGRVAQHAQEAQKAQDDATKKAKEAIDSQAELEAQKAAEQAHLEQQDALRQKAQLAQDNEDRANREMYLQSAANDLRSLEKRAADYQIDPDRRSMGAKVMGAIAVALGSYAAAWNGGRNTAADLVRQSIEDDIQAQRDELQNRRGAAATKQNELATLYQRYGSMDRAADARRLQLNAEAKARIDAVMSEYAAPEKQAEAERLKAQLDASSAESRTRLLQSFDRDYTQALTGAGTLAERTFAAERRSGRGGKPLPGAQTKELGDAIAAVRMPLELEQEFKSMTGPASIATRHLSFTPSAQYDVRGREFSMNMARKMYGAKVSNVETDRIMSLVPKASDWAGTEARNKFDMLQSHALQNAKDKLDAAEAAGYDVSQFRRMLDQAAHGSPAAARDLAASMGGRPRG